MKPVSLLFVATLAAVVGPTAAFEARTGQPPRLAPLAARRGKASTTPQKLGSFTIPPDAKCVDDVVGTQASAGTKLRAAAQLREMGMPLPLVYRPELSDEEKEKKAQLRVVLKWANLGVALFFLANVLESFLNAQFNLFPQWKSEWNYSGNNDKICAELKAQDPDKEYALCTDFNLSRIKPRYTPAPESK